MILRSSNWSVRPWSEAFFRAGPTTTTTGPPHSLLPSRACSSSFLHFIPLLVFITASCLSRSSALPLCYFPGKNPLPSIEEIIISLYTRFRKYIVYDEHDAAVVSSLVNPSCIANMNDSWGFPRINNIIARQLPKLLPMRAWINADLSTGFLTALLQVSIMMVGLHSYCTRMLTRWQVYRVIVVISRALFLRFLLAIPSESYIIIANFNMDDSVTGYSRCVLRVIPSLH